MPTRRSSRATVRDKENAPKLKKPTKSKKASPPEPMEASSLNNDTGISSQDSVGFGFLIIFLEVFKSHLQSNSSKRVFYLAKTLFLEFDCISSGSIA